MAYLKKELPLFISLLALFIIIPFEHTLAHSTGGNILGFIIIFAAIIYSSLNVAHHAEVLAHKYGEPYGTLILTVSAVVVEIVIIIIMMSHSHDPYLARDTIYSAVMLDINGLLGLAAILGGIKYGEQPYNVDSTNSYISMIIAAMGIAMILPHFVPQTQLAVFSFFMILVFVVLYIVFTRIQLKEHRYFFEYDNGDTHDIPYQEDKAKINGTYHAIILVLSIIIIGALSELLSVFMGNSLQTFDLPLALGAFSVAVISASPELITAVRSALKNNMQTVVNIAFGASLATVLLSVPAILGIGMLMGFEIDLALTPIQIILLTLTLIVSIVHFQDGETNVLEGALHFILFIVFFYFIFV